MKSLTPPLLSFFWTLCFLCFDFDGSKQRVYNLKYAKFDHPWAIEFLPNEKILLTEMRGSLKLLDNKGVFLEK